MTVPAAAAEKSTERDGDDRWIPAIAVVVGFSTQEQQGTVSSIDLNDPLSPPRPANSNDAYTNALEIGGNLELLTPVLEIPLRPRFFIGGEIVNVSHQRRRIAAEGDPSGLKPPSNALYPENAILGQGSSTVTDLDNVLYGASIGLSIPLDIGDWKLSIKPSARYLHREITFEGRVMRAYRPFDFGPTSELVLIDHDSKGVDAVGPGLEIEIEAARVKSLVASFYFGGGAYRVLGDRSIAFSQTRQDSLGQSTYRANWTADLDQWIYRAGLGLRVKWLGLPSGWFGGGNTPNDNTPNAPN